MLRKKGKIVKIGVFPPTDDWRKKSSPDDLLNVAHREGFYAKKYNKSIRVDGEKIKLQVVVVRESV